MSDARYRGTMRVQCVFWATICKAVDCCATGDSVGLSREESWRHETAGGGRVGASVGLEAPWTHEAEAGGRVLWSRTRSRRQRPGERLAREQSDSGGDPESTVRRRARSLRRSIDRSIDRPLGRLTPWMGVLRRCWSSADAAVSGIACRDSSRLLRTRRLVRFGRE